MYSVGRSYIHVVRGVWGGKKVCKSLWFVGKQKIKKKSVKKGQESKAWMYDDEARAVCPKSKA